MVEVKVSKNFKRDFDQYKNYIKTVYGIDIFYLNYDGTTSMPDKVQSIKLTECKTKRYLKMEDISKVVVEFMHEDCPHLREHDDLTSKWRNRDYMIFKRIFCIFAKDAGNTTVAIGRFLGNDHSTIIHQLRQANIHIEAKDRYFIDKYQLLKKKIDNVGDISEDIS